MHKFVPAGRTPASRLQGDGNNIASRNAARNCSPSRHLKQFCTFPQRIGPSSAFTPPTARGDPMDGIQLRKAMTFAVRRATQASRVTPRLPPVRALQRASQACPWGSGTKFCKKRAQIYAYRQGQRGEAIRANIIDISVLMSKLLHESCYPLRIT